MEKNNFIYSKFSQNLIKLKDKFKTFHPALQLSIFLFMILLISLVLTLPFYINQEKSVVSEEQIIVDQTRPPANKVEPLAQKQEELSEIDAVVKPSVSASSILKLESDQASYRVGEVIELQLKLTTLDLPDGIDFLIFYNSDLLTQVSIETVNPVGSFLSTELTTETGEIRGTWLRNPDEELDSMEELSLLKITAPAKRKGTVIFSFEQSQTQVAGLGGQEMLKEAKGLKIEIF
jgi:hypothetical protein